MTDRLAALQRPVMLEGRPFGMPFGYRVGT